jgi:ribose 5-phosphate isomerase B
VTIRCPPAWEKAETMRVAIGADEADPLLAVIEEELAALGHQVTRVGARPNAPVAWGQVALDIGHLVAAGSADQGIVCCYTGTGVSMAANKVAGVRAALCVDAQTASGARQWNDANVLALSLRLTSPTLAREIVRAWTSTPYAGSEAASLDALRNEESRHSAATDPSR